MFFLVQAIVIISAYYLKSDALDLLGIIAGGMFIVYNVYQMKSNDLTSFNSYRFTWESNEVVIYNHLSLGVGLMLFYGAFLYEFDSTLNFIHYLVVAFSGISTSRIKIE